MRNTFYFFNSFRDNSPMFSHVNRVFCSIDLLIQKTLVFSFLFFLIISDINAGQPQAIPVVTPEVAQSLSLLQKKKAKTNSYWKGKKIVWFGTSIPAGVVNAGESGGNGSYPERIGQILGATVYNESVGASRVRGGNHAAATENDPFGWSGMSTTGILFSLSLSSKEKQTFIDEWDTKWSGIVSDPTHLMDHLDKKKIQTFLDSSWDIKLTKYLSGGSCGPVDLYVFDHGFNEAVLPGMFNDMLDKPEDPTDRTYFLGAMAFLFKKILDDNYKARILIIGHYMNAETQLGIKDGIDKCCEAQERIAADWGFPIIKTWEHMRLSNNMIQVNGSEIPVFRAYFPDGVHPASDKTGYALKYYAEILAPLIENIR